MSKTMKKMLSVGIVSALLVCMAIPTAFAATATSVATVDFGSKEPVNGGTRTLYALPLSGTVEGTSNSYGSLTGEIHTKGAIFSHVRASATVEGKDSEDLYWANNGKDEGTFWAQCVSSKGNQGGKCTVYQEQ